MSLIFFEMVSLETGTLGECDLFLAFSLSRLISLGGNHGKMESVKGPQNTQALMRMIAMIFCFQGKRMH